MFSQENISKFSKVSWFFKSTQELWFYWGVYIPMCILQCIYIHLYMVYTPMCIYTYNIISVCLVHYVHYIVYASYIMYTI